MADTWRNLITDVPGLRVGNADDAALASGVTVLLFDEPAVASVFVPGGAPAGRDQECLATDRTLERIDALVLSGGSGFGLDAGGDVQAWLRERGRGLPVGQIRVPIAPTAILFDLLNGGDKTWGRYPPYRELAYAACEAASDTVALGTQGAGYGATTVDLKGGLGSASVRTTAGATVGAIVAVNALGSVVIGDGPHFWAAPFERGGEFGALGWPSTIPPTIERTNWKGRTEPGTTIAAIVTDAGLTKPDCARVAIMAATGIGRAIRLSAAPFDGDTVFAAATGRRPRGVDDLTELGSRAADCLTRAVARAVYAAEALRSPHAVPAWKPLYERHLAG